MKKILLYICVLLGALSATAQINTEQVLLVGQNALYFEDYMLSIQYFNRVIQSKPYLAKPYFLRSIAKINLEDYAGAEADATTAIDINPYLTDAWEVRGVARQNLGKNREAIADYDQALALLPRNRQLLFNKALAQQDCEDYAGADSTYGDLLRYYPGFENGYLGRARLRLEQADTTGAQEDIDKALSINKNAVNAYILRADIAINREQDYAAAISDMDEAIKLLPRQAGLYVNRAYLRYKLNDYFGAIADFDYAIQLDPLNRPALFNRGILQMEAAAYDKALPDFDRVLELDPDDYRALYNRALIRSAKGMYKEALADINRVIEQFPNLPNGFDIRASIYAAMRNPGAAQRDSEHALALARRLTPEAAGAAGSEDVPDTAEKSAEAAAREFASLLTVQDNAEIHEEYHNQAIRGKVQDRNLQIEPEGWIEISYYSAPSELRPHGYYIKEVDDINATRVLRNVLIVTPNVPAVDEMASNRHFESIEYYNSYIATHTPRAIDYIGRAMDFMSVRDYGQAIRDIDKALELTPDLAVGYLLRAQAGYHNLQAAAIQPADDKTDAQTRAMLRSKNIDDVLSDLNHVLDLAPRMAEAWYNKALVHIENEDYTSALAALNKAIELKPEMGEAWYNRGFVYLKLGNQRLGIPDLSRAGELGIIPAYNLIKRISNR